MTHLEMDASPFVFESENTLVAFVKELLILPAPFSSQAAASFGKPFSLLSVCVHNEVNCLEEETCQKLFFHID